MRLRQIESEQVEQADDQVELAGDAQIEQEVRDEVLNEVAPLVTSTGSSKRSW